MASPPSPLVRNDTFNKEIECQGLEAVDMHCLLLHHPLDQEEYLILLGYFLGLAGIRESCGAEITRVALGQMAAVATVLTKIAAVPLSR